MSDKHEVSPENAPLFLEWLKSRGGIARWESLDLSNPGQSWNTPALTNGEPTTKPNWRCGNKPSVIITDASEVEVVSYKEVNRFRVAIRSRKGGMSWRLTDGAQRKLDSALEKAGDGSTFEFDYDSQEAVISMPDVKVSLAEWKPK